MDKEYLVVLKKFQGGPGWNKEFEELIGKQVVAKALDAGSVYRGNPWVYVMNQWYWPIDATVPVDGVPPAEVAKAVKAAKKKVVRKKARKLALRSALNIQVMKSARHGHCCYFALEYEKGKQRIRADAPCHAAMPHTEGIAVACALNVKGHVSEGERTGNNYVAKKDVPAFRSYMNYLFNRSPYKHAFKTKKASEALDRGILMNVDAKFSHVISAAIAIRQASEHTGMLEGYTFLRKNGVSEDVAFLISNTWLKRAAGWTPHFGGAHQALSAEAVMYEKAINVFKNGLVIREQQSFKESLSYSYYVSGVWDGSVEPYPQLRKGDTVAEVMRKLCVPQVIGAGFNKKTAYTDKSVLDMAKAIQLDINKL